MADLYIGENDERELLWASLEKLPTYTRLRTAVLTKDLTSGCDKRSEIQEEEDLVDVSELNDLERQKLVERAFETNEIDNAILLENIRNRLGRYKMALRRRLTVQQGCASVASHNRLFASESLFNFFEVASLEVRKEILNLEAEEFDNCKNFSDSEIVGSSVKRVLDLGKFGRRRIHFLHSMTHHRSL